MEVDEPTGLRVFTLDEIAKLDRQEGTVINELKTNTDGPVPDPDQWLDRQVQTNIMITSIDSLINWGRRSSVWPFPMGLACCAFEMIAAAASRWDLARFGMEFLRPSPRQADLMLVAGTITWKMAPQVKRLYEQMAEPKWVLAMGACAISGGTFSESYSVVPGLNRIIPVDVYVPGCPPRPESLLHGIQMIHRKIAKESITIKR